MSTTRWLRIKDRAGRVLLALLVVSAISSVLWYRRMSVEESPSAPVGGEANDTSAEMVTRDFRHVETRMDRTIWILESAQAEMFEEEARLRTVKITWYGEGGLTPVVITSEEGKVNFASRNAELNGKVRIERADGSVLLTELLLWDEKSKILRAPLPVVIVTPTFTFKGEHLDANLTLEKVILWGQVQGEIRGGAVLPAQPS